MHVDSEKDPVETRVQGQCTISCIIYWSVNIMHASEIDPIFGLRNFGSMNSLYIQAIHPRNYVKEIGAWRAAELAKS